MELRRTVNVECVYSVVVMRRVNAEVWTIHVEMEIMRGVGCTCKMKILNRSSTQNNVNVESKCIIGPSCKKAVM